MRRGKWGGGNQKCRTAVLSRSYPGTGTVEETAVLSRSYPGMGTVAEVEGGNKRHAWNQQLPGSGGLAVCEK